LILGVIAAAALILGKTAARYRRHTRLTDQRLCPGCGTSHPSFAQFCRRCGKKL
jgi:predicted amidophosphoribosyltransferase